MKYKTIKLKSQLKRDPVNKKHVVFLYTKQGTVVVKCRHTSLIEKWLEEHTHLYGSLIHGKVVSYRRDDTVCESFRLFGKTSTDVGKYTLQKLNSKDCPHYLHDQVTFKRPRWCLVLQTEVEPWRYKNIIISSWRNLPKTYMVELNNFVLLPHTVSSEPGKDVYYRLNGRFVTGGQLKGRYAEAGARLLEAYSKAGLLSRLP